MWSPRCSGRWRRAPRLRSCGQTGSLLVEGAVALVVLGIIAAATASLMAWAASQQARANATYDGVESGHVALQAIGQLVRSAGAEGKPALWEVSADRLVLCGVGWRGQAIRGQVTRDGQGRLLFAAVPQPAPPADRCPGDDPAAPIDLAPGFTFEQVTFSVKPWQPGSGPAECGPAKAVSCRGVTGVYVQIRFWDPGSPPGPGVTGYVALRNPGGP